MKIRTVFIAPGILLFFLVLFLITNDYQQRRSDFIERRLAVLQTRVEATGRTLSSFSRYVFEETVNRTAVLALMKEAATADEQTRTTIRARLESLVSEDYEHLQRYDFRQFHFQLPDNTSFLRMHSPDKFGDDLTGVRETVRIVNETKEPVVAFEPGRIYNAYRFVYPLILDGEHYGSVELSFSMNSFLDILSQLEKADYYFGIRRNAVESIIFEDDRTRYMDSCFSPEFLFDREVLPEYDNKGLFEKTADLLHPILDSGQNGGYAAMHQGSRKLVLVHFVKDLSGRPVACFVAVSDDTVLSNYLRDYLVIIGISVAIFLTLFGAALILFREREKMKHLSLTDMLTGLRNRTALVGILEQEMDRVKRYDKPLSVMMIDIDNFKQVNDRFGHAEGDTVLKNLARLMSSALRASDYAGRWGGEEFLVLLTDTPYESGVIAAENFCAEVASTYLSTLTPVTISIGITAHIADDSIDSLIARADDALYEAKRQGKNRAVGIRKN